MKVKLWLALIASTFVVGACGNSEGSVGASPPTNPEGKVLIEGLTFEPETLNVAVGTTVVWENRDAVAHTVTAGEQGKQGAPGVTEDQPAKPSGLFDEELEGDGATFSYTFDEAGTYRYYCDIHRQMTAAIVVQ